MTLFLNTPEAVVLPGGVLGTGPSTTYSRPLMPSSPSVQELAVPSVLGMPQQPALQLLEDFGFATTVVQVPGQGKEGEVYGQQPRPDDIVRRGSLVRVFVITGPDAEEAKLAQIAAGIDDLKESVSGLRDSMGKLVDLVQGAAAADGDAPVAKSGPADGGKQAKA